MKAIPLALAILFTTAELRAQETTQPIRYTWITTSCENWNCAAAAFVLAGDSSTFVLPTGNEKRPWLVVRRVEEGSVFIPEDEPFACEVFDGMNEAMSSYEKLDPCHGATLMNVNDGRSVVLALRECEPGSRRRAAGH
jgi:hypothetical protein